MWEAFLVWLAEKILNYLLGLAAKAVKQKAEEIARDKERGETNEANAKAYEDAVTREERRAAALRLLNRNHP